MTDVLTQDQRKTCMRQIKFKDTLIEVTLRKALWKNGYRYRKNSKILPGKPDIVFTKYKIAVFCDSEYFHGRDWDSYLLPKLQKTKNSEFWIKKISRNIERDREINEQLELLGWTVIRFWGKDIIKNTAACVAKIEEGITRRKK